MRTKLPLLLTTALGATGMCLFVALDAYFSGRELDLDATARELALIVMYGSVARVDAPPAEV